MKLTAYAFVARAVPKAQPRARATSFGGKPRMWTPSTADSFKSAVSMAASMAIPRELTPILDGFSLVAVFYLPRPKRLLTKKFISTIDIPMISKPDIDNLVKAALDALVDAGVVRDDAPLWDLTARKYYADAGEDPRAEFLLTANTETT